MTKKQYEKLVEFKTVRIAYFVDGKIINLPYFVKELKNYYAEDVLQSGEFKDKVSTSGKKKYWADYILRKKDLEVINKKN